MDEISKTDGIPLYVKIRESLREKISSGELERGQKLPSEDELAAHYGVSRMTVRQSTSDLIDDGLLYRRHGVGTFVTLPHIERDHSQLTDFFENSTLHGINARVTVLEIVVLPATSKIAQRLSLRTNDALINIKTIRQVDEILVTLHDSYLPHKLFSDFIQVGLLTFEVQHLWSKFAEHGYPVKWATQKLEARLADPNLAELMQVNLGSPILFKERTVYAENGTPVEFTYCYNRGDMYSLTVKLIR